MSPSQKIWKTEERGPRKFSIAAKYDSTIEKNEDFIKFNESRKQAAENLTNRPKPPLGGGPVVDSTNTDEGGEEGGELVAAIVRDLLEKKAAARRAKKKLAADKKKISNSKSKMGDKGKMAKAPAEGEKKKKRTKKKSSRKKSGHESTSKNVAKAQPQPKTFLKKA